jgi:hypothetical protein
MLGGLARAGQLEARTAPHKLIVESPALRTGEPMEDDRRLNSTIWMSGRGPLCFHAGV